MDQERLESLRIEYTDQYVMVHSRRPELARFKGKIGRVITINWNGRALVQFDSGSDRGWYDIDLDDLRVVDNPPPGSEADKAAGTLGSSPQSGQPVGYKPSALEVARQAKEKAASPPEDARPGPAPTANKHADRAKPAESSEVHEADHSDGSPPNKEPATGA